MSEVTEVQKIESAKWSILYNVLFSCVYFDERIWELFSSLHYRQLNEVTYKVCNIKQMVVLKWM